MIRDFYLHVLCSSVSGSHMTTSSTPLLPQQQQVTTCSDSASNGLLEHQTTIIFFSFLFASLSCDAVDSAIAASPLHSSRNGISSDTEPYANHQDMQLFYLDITNHCN